MRGIFSSLPHVLLSRLRSILLMLKFTTVIGTTCFDVPVTMYAQVTAKRTNVPGMKAFRGRRFNPYFGYRPRRPYPPPYGYAPYGYGWVSAMDFHPDSCGVHIS